MALLERNYFTKVHLPEALKVVDDFPMTSTGKFQRSALRGQGEN